MIVAVERGCEGKGCPQIGFGSERGNTGAVAGREPDDAAGSRERSTLPVAFAGIVHIDSRQHTEHGPGGGRGPQHPFPVVAHDRALLRRGIDELDGAEQVAQADIQQAAHSRLYQDVCLDDGNEAGQSHPNGVAVGRESIERKCAFIVGQGFQKDAVLSIEQDNGRAHLRNAGSIGNQA
jgi:hypothetical protein